MKYKDMTPEKAEAKKAKRKIRYEKRREECKARTKKYKAEHLEEHKAYMKKYRDEHSEECKARKKKYLSENLNKNGVTKNQIRVISRRFLNRTHSKLDGYEIHHCFGYEDPNKFIYIPKTLHLKIHQLLRDNNIPADSDHWNVIRDLVNSCEEYTYIRT